VLAKRISLYLLSTVAVWIFINPALYVHPLGATVRYFSFRSYQSANIGYHVPNVALDTIGERTGAVVCTLVLRSCGSHTAGGALFVENIFNALWVGFAVIGITYAGLRRDRHILFLLLLIYLSAVGILHYYPIMGRGTLSSCRSCMH
jgi:hypothetical protein